MDERVNAYIESLVSDIISQPNLTNLSPEEKTKYADEIRDRFYNVILDTVIDNLNSEQLAAIKDLPIDSDEMEKKLTEYSASIPYMYVKFEENLKKEVENIKNNPIL